MGGLWGRENRAVGGGGVQNAEIQGEWLLVMEGAENMVVKDLDTGKKYVLDGTGSLETETGQKVVLEQFKAEVRGRPGGTSMVRVCIDLWELIPSCRCRGD